MGVFSVSSYAYYTDGAGSYSNPVGYDTLLSTFSEVVPNDDNTARPGEVVDPDYSGAPATFIGLVDFGGQTFLFMEDEFGFFLGHPTVLPLASFPTSFLDTEIDDGLTDTFPACFLDGTLIATPGGACSVADLKIGSIVCGHDGRSATVKWIGRQAVSTRFGPADRLMPIRISAGALGNGLPLRDLSLTADHALLIDGMLINAGALVNGTTITRVPVSEFGDTYTVYHVETENHDVILAEGTPAETFIDYVGRQAFDNYQEYLDLYGAERIIAEMDRPRISTRRLLPEEIKARLRCEEAAIVGEARLTA